MGYIFLKAKRVILACMMVIALSMGIVFCADFNQTAKAQQDGYTVSFTGNVLPYNFASIGSGSSFFSPKTSDIVVYTDEYGKNPEGMTITISIKSPLDIDFAEYSEGYEFLQIGVYTIRYSFTLADLTGQTERKLEVVDMQVPLLTADAIPEGLKPDTLSVSTDTVVYLRGITGTTIKLPAVSVKDNRLPNEDITCLLVNNTGQSQDITDKIDDISYRVALDSQGIYAVVYRVQNTSGLIGSLLYHIDIRDEWHTLQTSPMDSVVYTLSGAVLPDCAVLDFDGNKIDKSVNIVISRNGIIAGTYAPGQELNLHIPGDYLVEYIVDGELNSSSAFTIVDNSKPKIVLNNASYRSNKGKTVKIADILVTDNDAVKAYNVRVQYNGEDVNIYDGTFVADEKGVYIVTITAEDISGNIVTEQYLVNVGQSVVTIVTIIAASLLVIGCAFFAIMVIVKRKNIKKTKTIDINLSNNSDGGK